MKENKVVSSIIGLILILEEKHFKDGEIRVNCKGTIRAEFWKKDVENILFNEQDRFLKVLEVAESQWPSKYLLLCNLFMICSKKTTSLHPESY